MKQSYNNRRRYLFSKIFSSFLIFLLLLSLTGCESFPAILENGQSAGETLIETEDSDSPISMEEIPAYSGEPYIEINENVPRFDEEDYRREPFEQYSPLDELGRCQTAFACISPDLMPTEGRGSIGQIKPSGWHTIKYDIVDGKYLYNRCHLIGFQLTGENANEKNLITGTRYMNTEGMLPFENMVADYIKETSDQVLYRVTPRFTGDNLVADGVEIEASSVSDNGQSIQFHVFVYNVQPGILIDYTDGSSRLADSQGTDNTSPSETEMEIRGNKSSKIYHCPGQRDYEEMADSKNLIVFHSEQEAIDAGYRKAKN